MKNLKLKLEYSLPADAKQTSVDLTLDYLIAGVNMKYKDGLEGQLRRVFGRIQRKMDEAQAKQYDVLELEDSEFDLLSESFEDAKFPSALSKYINVLEEEIERAGKENKLNMAKERLYLVKREVMAKNIREAMTKHGKIYAIELVSEEFQKQEEMNVLGFDKLNKNKKDGETKL